MPSKTVVKRTLKEARATVAQSQYNLKRNIIELENERRAIREERAEAILALGLLAARYGINGWSPEQTLASIITHITAELPPPAHAVHAPPAARPVAAPEPLSPTTIESAGTQHRAVCGCGWRSAWFRREAEADQAAMAHEERLHT